MQYSIYKYRDTSWMMYSTNRYRSRQLALIGGLNYLMTAILRAFFEAVVITVDLKSLHDRLILLVHSVWAFPSELSTAVWNDPNSVFIVLLVLRYYRLIVHVASYVCFYSPVKLPIDPKILPRHAHVILPTIDPLNSDFESCLTSCLEKLPGCLTVVTAGPGMLDITRQEMLRICGKGDHRRFPCTSVRVVETREQNKRIQIAHVIRSMAQEKEKNRNTIIVLLDDHVQWPHQDFLKLLLAPFETANVAFVGTNKRVKRERGDSIWSSLLNFIAVTYLERHNFEIRATNAIDGGVFVVSGRTSAVRAELLMDDQFLESYTSERFFFGKFGPLAADDDNFITRYVVNSGRDIKIQYCEGSLITTSLGTVGGYRKFFGQLIRWARTTWRSNSCSLFTDRTVWRRQPWCLHAEYLKSFTNFALFVDPLVLYFWYRSTYAHFQLWIILTIIFGSKLVKLASHFLREPRDLVWFPCYVIFAYLHSFIKLYALFTFWDCAWLGRKLEAFPTESDVEISRHDDNADLDLQFYGFESDEAQYVFGENDSSIETGSLLLSLKRDATNHRSTVTPYGRVGHCNRALTPANVRESSASRVSTNRTSSRTPSIRSQPFTLESEFGVELNDSDQDTFDHNPYPTPGADDMTVRTRYAPRITHISPLPPSPSELHPVVLRKQISHYNRRFDRVKSCERIHGDGSHATNVARRSGYCSTPGLSHRPVGYVVPGRPRF